VRTAEAYELTLNNFRSTLRGTGLDLDSELALVAPLAQGWARSSRREGMTVNYKIGCRNFVIYILTPMRPHCKSI
jgi:hypothetical protein